MRTRPPTLIVARKDTDGADWGVSWEAAQNDPAPLGLIRGRHEDDFRNTLLGLVTE
jgi:hypothetical protein